MKVTPPKFLYMCQSSADVVVRTRVRLLLLFFVLCLCLYLNESYLHACRAQSRMRLTLCCVIGCLIFLKNSAFFILRALRRAKVKKLRKRKVFYVSY